MTFRTTLKLQLAYILFAILYNLVSIISSHLGLDALTPTNPISGIVFMLAVGLGVYLGFRRFYRLYGGVMLFALAVITYGGVFTHFMQLFSSDFPTGYASEASWAIAILINLVGLVTGFIGCIQALHNIKLNAPRKINVQAQ